MQHSAVWTAARVFVLLACLLLLVACGNDSISEEARAFADEHWDGDKYLQGLYEVYYLNNQDASPDDPYLDTIRYMVLLFSPDGWPDTLVEARWSHHAFYHNDGSSVGEEEFYRNIGRYHQFTFGWDDYPGVGDPDFPYHYTDTTRLVYVSPNRSTYLRMIASDARR